MTAPQTFLEAGFRLSVPGFKLNVSLTLNPELAVIFGPSGAGKSMLLRTLAGLLTPDEGQITLGGRIMYDSAARINIPPQERGIGYTPQQYALFPHLTVRENIAYGLFRWEESQKTKRLEELIDLMRLTHVSDRRPREVSGGEQQRTALARALAPRPSILLMDEPFAAVDEVLREHLRQEILRVQQQLELPILLVTHNLVEAYTLADRVIIFQAGSVAQEGSREEVFRQPSSPAIAELMAMDNVITVGTEPSTGNQIHLLWWGQKVVLENRQQDIPGDELTLGIRPEDITIVRKSDRPLRQEGDIFFEAQLEKDQPRGFDHRLTFRVENDEQSPANLIVRIPHPVFLRLRLKVGEQRTLAIRVSDLHIFDPQPEQLPHS